MSNTPNSIMMSFFYFLHCSRLWSSSCTPLCLFINEAGGCGQGPFYPEVLSCVVKLVEQCLWINAIYPLLQCQSSSGSVGKSI